MNPDARALPRTLAVVALLISMGCATGSPSAGGQTTRLDQPALELDVQHEARGREQAIQVPLADAWSRLPGVYEKLAIPLTAHDPAHHSLGNTGLRIRTIENRRMSTYLDCGSGLGAMSYADERDVTMSVVTTLMAEGAGGTKTTTVVSASAKARDVNSYPVACTSTGALEKRIATLLTLEGTP